jgi:hypothetical protein
MHLQYASAVAAVQMPALLSNILVCHSYNAFLHLLEREMRRRQLCAIAAQRLEFSPSMYRPNMGMFASACKCWVNVRIGWPEDDVEAAGWHIYREEGRLIIPRFAADDELIETDFTGVEETVLPIEHLQEIVCQLDNDDMVEFFRHVCISSRKRFEAFFVPDFVSSDARLVFIRDFIASTGNSDALDDHSECDSKFFDGPKQAIQDRRVFDLPPFRDHPPSQYTS